MNRMSWPAATADLSDLLAEKAHILALQWRSFGGLSAFRGPVVTFRGADDNSRIRAILEEPGEGRVLVIDNGGSQARSIFGDTFGGLMRDNGWAGAIINGFTRDAAGLAGLPVGLFALGVSPLRPLKTNVGERDAAISIAGVAIRTGDWVAADPDGVVVVGAAVQP